MYCIRRAGGYVRWMISFSLKCEKGHRFDSWFASAEAFDRLEKTGHLVCAVCGDPSVSKAVMAPSVRPARKAATPPVPVPATSEKTKPSPEQIATAMAEIRKNVEENSDYVGGSFASEARAIHDGDAPERAIYGEAKIEDARSLIEDGVAVTPLPFIPRRKTN